MKKEVQAFLTTLICFYNNSITKSLFINSNRSELNQLFTSVQILTLFNSNELKGKNRRTAWAANRLAGKELESRRWVTNKVKLRARKVSITLEIWPRPSSSRSKRLSIIKWLWINLQVKPHSRQTIMWDILNCFIIRQLIQELKINLTYLANLHIQSIRSTTVSTLMLEVKCLDRTWWMIILVLRPLSRIVNLLRWPISEST